MTKYVVVVERAEKDGRLLNYAAYAPDVPGCVTVGDPIEETRRRMQEALEFHFDGMLEAGEPIPEPKTSLAEALAQHKQFLQEEGLLSEPEPEAVLVDVELPAHARAESD